MEQENRLINVFELAERLQVTVNTVRVLYRKGRIPKIKLGHRNVRFLWSDVVQALKTSNDPEVKRLRERQPNLPLD